MVPAVADAANRGIAALKATPHYYRNIINSDKYQIRS
jgi:hypothetical protein